jgi:hypothetical protein
MEEDAHEHGHEVHAQLANYHVEAIHFQQFGGDQEEHADRRHPARNKSQHCIGAATGEKNVCSPNDPSGDDHHRLAERAEEAEQRCALGAHFAQGDAHHGGKDDQAQDVGALGVVVRDFPLVQAFHWKNDALRLLTSGFTGRLFTCSVFIGWRHFEHSSVLQT